jgi:hypothetical protein
MKLLKKTINLEEATGPTVTEMMHLQKMVTRQVELQQKLEDIFEKSYAITEELNELRLKKLPEYAKSIGVTSITLDTGEKFEIKEELTAKIPEKHHFDCMIYLRSHGHGSLIKNELSLKFDASKDDEKIFGKALNLLRKNNIPFAEKQSVRSGTLKKFARERIEAGDWTFDRSKFGVYEVRQSVINGKKPPRYKK